MTFTLHVRATLIAILLALGQAAVAWTQERALLTIEGSEFVVVRFENARGIRKVESGRPDPLPPEVSYQVLVSGDPSRSEDWQLAAHRNARFFVDGPKVGFGDGKPPDYDRGSKIYLPDEKGIAIHAGSYAEYTPDPLVPVILSRRGENNLASNPILLTREANGATEYFAAMGIEPRDFLDIRLVYHSTKDQPMVLISAGASVGPGIAYRPHKPTADGQPRKAAQLLDGVFIQTQRTDDPEAQGKVVDFSQPNPVTALAQLLQIYGRKLLIGAQFISASELLGPGPPPDDASARGLVVRRTLEITPKALVRVVWTTDTGREVKTEWLDPATGQMVEPPARVGP